MFRLTVVACFALFAAAGSSQDLPKLHTVLVDGQPFTFEDRNGLAMVDGDIIAGNTDDLDPLAGKTTSRSAFLALNSLGAPPLWPQGVLYYVIDPALNNPQRVQDAIDYWNQNTPLQLKARTAQTDYVRFVSQAGNCASSVGRVGGQQTIVLDDGCSTGNVIHEIGHAFGLLHEQSRNDRNAYLTLRYENIDTVYFSQYAQIRSSRDVGYYDYDSTMHYSTTGFSANGKSTQTTNPPGIPIGQRLGLSAGDFDAISRVYGYIPTKTTITTIPEGLKLVIDGETVAAPASFEWAAGTKHQIGVLDNQSSTTGSSRYRFVRWTDGGDLAHTFTAGPDLTVIAAQFQQRVALNLLTNPSTGGTVTVTPTSPDGYYPVSTEVQVTAKANTGQQFQFWSGTSFSVQGYGSGSSVMSVELNGPTTLLANFTDKPVTTITSTPPGQFVVVDGLTYQTPVRFAWTTGTQHTLNVRVPQYSLTSATRYRYVSWDDGVSEASRTVTAGAQGGTYSVRFLQQHYLDFSRAGNTATLTVDPSQDSGYIDAGTTVDLRVTTATGQSVQYWLGDVSGTSNTRSLLMNKPQRAVAVVGPTLPFRVVHSGTYSSSPSFEQPGSYVAPLELITLFGANAGPATATNGTVVDGRLTTSAGGTRVLFDNVPAPILYASSTQVSAFVPAEIAGKSIVTISLERDGKVTGTTPYAVTPTLPGLFASNSSGAGQVLALNADGTRNSKDRPAAPGSFVTLYATGTGLMDRAVNNGEVMSATLARVKEAVFARIGKEIADVFYAGSAPTLVNGIVQVNIRVPETLTTGEWPIQLVAGTAVSAPGMTIAVK